MTNTVKIGLDSAGMVEALRRHHPAYSGDNGMQWLCLQEWARIDLLALECWQAARVIGYEVKVSRSDMRAELLDPSKRMTAVGRCTQFYIAVPSGMLTSDELAFEEPFDWSFDDYERQICTNPDCHARRYLTGRGWMKRARKPRGSSRRGTDSEGESISFGPGVDSGTHPDGSTYYNSYERRACCVVCSGYGRLGRSRVEVEAPTLWVPRDCGLVEVSANRGVVTVKTAPVNKTPAPIIGGEADPSEHRNRLQRHGLALLARHASAYQDPRHRGHRAG